MSWTLNLRRRFFCVVFSFVFCPFAALFLVILGSVTYGRMFFRGRWGQGATKKRGERHRNIELYFLYLSSWTNCLHCWHSGLSTLKSTLCVCIWANVLSDWLASLTRCSCFLLYGVAPFVCLRAWSFSGLPFSVGEHFRFSRHPSNSGLENHARRVGIAGKEILVKKRAVWFSGKLLLFRIVTFSRVVGGIYVHVPSLAERYPHLHRWTRRNNSYRICGFVRCTRWNCPLVLATQDQATSRLRCLSTITAIEFLWYLNYTRSLRQLNIFY